jgi:hypothetical protein
LEVSPAEGTIDKKAEDHNNKDAKIYRNRKNPQADPPEKNPQEEFHAEAKKRKGGSFHVLFAGCSGRERKGRWFPDRKETPTAVGADLGMLRNFSFTNYTAHKRSSRR